MARKMKDSGVEWIGEIPENWDVSKIKYELECKDELREPISAEKRERNNPQYDYYGASGVIDKIDYYNVDDEVLLIGEDGANLVMRNLPLIYKAKGKFWVNNHAHILKPYQHNNYNYFSYLLETGDYINFITGSAQPKLSQSKLMSFYVLRVPIIEQQKIADFLDEKVREIDSVIAKTKETIEDYKKYKQAIITDAVTKGLNSNVEMRDTGSEWIGKIPVHWDYVRMQRLFEIVDERNDDPNACLLSLYTSLGVKPRSELEEKGNKAATVMNYKIVKKDDVIVNKLLAWMGAIGYSDYEGVTSPDYDVYRAKEGAPVVKTYYNEYFRHTCFNGDCYKYGHGIMLMRWRTYPEELLRIKVPNPPLEEQKEIAEYLDEKCSEIDKLIAKKEELLVDLEDYKKSLIYEYVTGKKEV